MDVKDALSSADIDFIIPTMRGKSGLMPIDVRRLALLHRVRRDVHNHIAALRSSFGKPVEDVAPPDKTSFVFVPRTVEISTSMGPRTAAWPRVVVGPEWPLAPAAHEISHLLIEQAELIAASYVQQALTRATNQESVEERRRMRKHLESLLRLVNRTIALLLRLAGRAERLIDMVVSQSAFFVIHGEHPPRVSGRAAFGPIFCAGGCAA